MNRHKDDLLWYLDYSMEPIGNLYIRKFYTIIDIFRDVGAILNALVISISLILKVFIFKKGELKILKRFLLIKKQDTKSLKRKLIPLET